jgi:membrane protease YdiL (CAAX protease family)
VVGIGLGRRLGLVSGLLVIGLALLGLLAAFWRESAAGSAPLFSYLIGTLALGPIAEELYFRGAWLDFAARSFPKAAAAPLVSTAFGLLHVPQGGLVPMLILSLLLCAITLYTRSVLGAIGAHVLWNALVGLRLVPNNPGRWEVVLVASVAIGLAFALAWLLRRESDDCA